MKIRSGLTVGICMGLALAAAPAPARAELIRLDDTVLSGQGIGAVLTVLTLQTTGSETTESGGVAYTDGDFHAFGQYSPPDGSPKNQAFTYADAGATGAYDLALLVNLAEPNSEDPPSTNAIDSSNLYADTITLNVWDADGNLLQQHKYDGGLLEMDESGVGGSGLIFVLDAAEADALNALGSDVIFTVGATFANAGGGNDVIQATAITQNTPVPEPASLLLLGTGMLGVARGVVKRRKNA